MIELNIFRLENGHSKSYLFDFSSFIIRLVIVLLFLHVVVALTFFSQNIFVFSSNSLDFFDNSQVVTTPIAIPKYFSNLIPFRNVI